MKKAFVPTADGHWGLAIHGGAGEISDKASIPVRRAEFEAIHETGRQMLIDGATAMEVVETVVSLLEDCPYFNAGRGSVFTTLATHEMDACIMNGTTGAVGAVANVGNVRNPIKLARAVQTGTQHVLMAGLGAESLAPTHGIKREDNHYFFTEERYAQLKVARESKSVVLDHGGTFVAHKESYSKIQPEHLHVTPREEKDLALETEKMGFAAEHKFSTVGCVARDKYGNLASAGSTGGLCNKQPGRVGDTPIPGAGVYANSSTCAVACTGHGETFIKNCVAYDIHARVKYTGCTLEESMSQVVMKVLPGATGGCVGVDKHGNAHAVYNTSGMFTGLANYKGQNTVFHKDDLTTISSNAVALIVPSLLDKFDSAGHLKVIYNRPVGAVSAMQVNVGSSIAAPLSQLTAEPKVYFPSFTPPLPPGGRYGKAYLDSQKNGPTKPDVQYHTLVMVEPCYGDNEPKDGGRAVLRWMIANVPDNNVEKGKVIVPYNITNCTIEDGCRGTRPAPDATHMRVFAFLVLRHNGTNNKIDPAVVPNMAALAAGTEPLDVRNFIQSLNVRPVMASVCQADTDQ